VRTEAVSKVDYFRIRNIAKTKMSSLFRGPNSFDIKNKSKYLLKINMLQASHKKYFPKLFKKPTPNPTFALHFKIIAGIAAVSSKTKQNEQITFHH
jgi:hypothetical protein